MKDVTIYGGYYKQGDDLAHHLEEGRHPAESLSRWAAQLQAAAERIREVAAVVADYQGIELDGDTHYVGLSSLPAEALERLSLLDAIHVEEIEDEEEDEEFEDDPGAIE